MSAEMELAKTEEGGMKRNGEVTTFGSGSKKRAILIGIAVAIIIIIIVVVVTVVVVLETKKDTSSGSPDKPTNHSTPTPTPTGPLPTPTGPLPPPTAPPGADGPYSQAAVAADVGKCSEIGRDIMKKNGSAVDSAVAALFCTGVINIHSAGIGGGGFMVVYNRKNKSSEVFDFREEAPGNASVDMYVNSSLSSRYGPSASGVPGEVKGFYAAWKKYGRLPWKQVVQPSIDLAKNGIQIADNTYYAMTRSSVKRYILKDPGLSGLLTNKNGDLKKLGEVIKQPKLAKTLESIRDDPEGFYSGKLAEDIVHDVQSGGGIITLQDMKNYQVKIRKSLDGTLGDYRLYSIPPPGSGAVMALVFNILKGYNMTSSARKDVNSSILTYHRIVEAFKFAYAYRALLGDQDFVNLTNILRNMSNPNFGEALRHKIYDNQTFTDYRYYGDFYSKGDSGTSHLSLISPDGDAVSATTTINLYFGSRYRGPRTGIIFNNEMDDFSTPGVKNAFGVEPSAANFIKPGKRPMSSSAPAIFVDNHGDVRMVAGASGGTKITTATSLAVMNYLWFNRTLAQSVEDPRLHHQLMPMYVRIDKDYPMPQAIIDGLKRLGHTVLKKSGFAVVQAVSKDKNGLIYGKGDPKKGTWAAGF